MTVPIICPNGSAPNTGVASQVHFTPDVFTRLLPPDWAWLNPWVGLSEALTFDVAEFCALDPPEVEPFPSALDFAAALITPDVTVIRQIGRFCASVLANHLWYQMCHCLIDATPPAPSSPGPPTGLPAVNPPALTPPILSTPCAGDTFQATGCFTGNTFAGGPTVPVGLTVTAVEVVINATPCGSGTSGVFNWLVKAQDAGGNALQTTTYSVGPGTYQQRHILPFFPGAAFYSFNINQVSGVGGQTITGSQINFYCGAAPGAPALPCCPPDPSLLSLLEQILRLVTVTQRQVAPFGYVPGAVHSGLTGHGSFAVSGILGVMVHLSATNLSGGLRDGSPQELFDQGFITLGTADGYEHSRRLDHVDQLVLPIAAGAFTAVGYTLEVGVTATITELLRES